MAPVWSYLSKPAVVNKVSCSLGDVFINKIVISRLLDKPHEQNHLFRFHFSLGTSS